MTALSAQLRAARAELEKYNREHRPLTAQTTVRSTPPVTSTTYSYTPQYRHYAYPYAQYGSNYTQVYPGFATTTPSTTQYQYPAITTASATGTNTPSQTTPTQTQPTTATPTTSEALSKPVSLSLPISSLPALHALGIMPVSSLSVPPPGQPQPQAILKGTTANGTVLSLEVNIGLLQATQVSGLALIINAIAAQAVSATSSQSGASST